MKCMSVRQDEDGLLARVRRRLPVLRQAKHVHFIGIGGAGMSALAQFLASEGCAVTGSDRGYDRGQDAWLYERLQAQGIRLSSQSAPALDPLPDCVVVTRAVEDTNPEISLARSRGIPVLKRPELLAAVIHGPGSIAVSGSCGKTTTAAMIAQIAEYAGLEPTVMLGAAARRYQTDRMIGNFRQGSGNVVIAEVDESDGSVSDFRPEVAVLTNISKDHYEPRQLIQFFLPFLEGAETTVINMECRRSRSLHDGLRNRLVGFGSGTDIEATVNCSCRDGACFTMGGRHFTIPYPGKHNVANALCAIATAREMGVEDATSRRALAEFGGVLRRWILTGSPRGIDIIDDFAHSPSKISSALDAAHMCYDRVHAVFQPHGYGPTRFLWDEYLDAFAGALRPPDRLYLLDIFDAGGTADRSISSDHLAGALKPKFSRVTKPADRGILIEALREDAAPGEVILIMGARDHSLTRLACEIGDALSP